MIVVPRRTCRYRLAKHRADNPPKGPWQAPIVDRIKPAVVKLAAEWPAWWHRKIWTMGRYAGWELRSQSSVRRAMARRGLLQPVSYRAERYQLAKPESTDWLLAGAGGRADVGMMPGWGRVGLSGVCWGVLG